MAFTVEDGTGLSTANAYESVANVKAFLLDRGRDLAGGTPSYTDDEIEDGIVNATDYIDKRWGKRFRGWQATSSQSLQWPRTDAFDNSVYTFPALPNELLWATSEYTRVVLDLGRNLAPIPTPPFSILDPIAGTSSASASGRLTETTDKVGPIEEKRRYSADADSKPMTTTGNMIQNIPEYPQADLWIEELLNPQMSREVVRGG